MPSMSNTTYGHVHVFWFWFVKCRRAELVSWRSTTPRQIHKRTAFLDMAELFLLFAELALQHMSLTAFFLPS